MSSTPNLEDRVNMIDRDLADIGAKVNAHTEAINALGVQTRERFDVTDRRLKELNERTKKLESDVEIGFAKMDGRFAAMDGRFAAMDGRFAAMDSRFSSMDRKFFEIDEKFRQVDLNFVEVNNKLDVTAAGIKQIAGLLTTFIEQRGSETP